MTTAQIERTHGSGKSCHQHPSEIEELTDNIDYLTFDSELIDAARSLRYESPAGWLEFLAEHPELAAEAAKPKLSKDAKGAGSSKGLEPYRCWDRDDRGRWNRKKTDAWPEGMDPEAYTVSQKQAANQNQLEVCRVCGEKLHLPTDADGRVHRDVGAQPEYCSQRCRDDVKNARARAGRAEVSPRRKPERRLPDLSMITVAGVGDMDTAPDEWNRMQPRRHPEMFRPVRVPSESVPCLHVNARSRQIATEEVREIFAEEMQPYVPECEGYRLPVHQLVADLRRRPAERDETVAKVDRIARRYGTGGTPKPPAPTPGWDQVASFWRYFPPRQRVQYAVISEDNNTWHISHCISVQLKV
ncbi:hypothetical protein [Rhodococcus sp. 24CO]|uniref:hypothetical protein n=1 Tax=Rhodococcus sp. 24CO TaxID=3117460 RepID=UPI003D336A7E